MNLIIGNTVHFIHNGKLKHGMIDAWVGKDRVQILTNEGIHLNNISVKTILNDKGVVEWEKNKING